MTKTIKQQKKNKVATGHKAETFKLTPMMKMAVVCIIGMGITIFIGAGFILLSLISGLGDDKRSAIKEADTVALTLPQHTGEVINVDVHNDGVYVVIKHNENKSYKVYYYEKGQQIPILRHTIQ